MIKQITSIVFCLFLAGSTGLAASTAGAGAGTGAGSGVGVASENIDSIFNTSHVEPEGSISENIAGKDTRLSNYSGSETYAELQEGCLLRTRESLFSKCPTKALKELTPDGKGCNWIPYLVGKELKGCIIELPSKHYLGVLLDRQHTILDMDFVNKYILKNNGVLPWAWDRTTKSNKLSESGIMTGCIEVDAEQGQLIYESFTTLVTKIKEHLDETYASLGVEDQIDGLIGADKRVFPKVTAEISRPNLRKLKSFLDVLNLEDSTEITEIGATLNSGFVRVTFSRGEKKYFLLTSKKFNSTWVPGFFSLKEYGMQNPLSSYPETWSTLIESPNPCSVVDMARYSYFTVLNDFPSSGQTSEPFTVADMKQKLTQADEVAHLKEIETAFDSGGRDLDPSEYGELAGLPAEGTFKMIFNAGTYQVGCREEDFCMVRQTTEDGTQKYYQCNLLQGDQIKFEKTDIKDTEIRPIHDNISPVTDFYKKLKASKNAHDRTVRDQSLKAAKTKMKQHYNKLLEIVTSDFQSLQPGFKVVIEKSDAGFALYEKLATELKFIPSAVEACEVGEEGCCLFKIDQGTYPDATTSYHYYNGNFLTPLEDFGKFPSDKPVDMPEFNDLFVWPKSNWSRFSGRPTLKGNISLVKSYSDGGSGIDVRFFGEVAGLSSEGSSSLDWVESYRAEREAQEEELKRVEAEQKERERQECLKLERLADEQKAEQRRLAKQAAEEKGRQERLTAQNEEEVAQAAKQELEQKRLTEQAAASRKAEEERVEAERAAKLQAEQKERQEQRLRAEHLAAKLERETEERCLETERAAQQEAEQKRLAEQATKLQAEKEEEREKQGRLRVEQVAANQAASNVPTNHPIDDRLRGEKQNEQNSSVTKPESSEVQISIARLAAISVLLAAGVTTAGWGVADVIKAIKQRKKILRGVLATTAGTAAFITSIVFLTKGKHLVEPVH